MSMSPDDAEYSALLHQLLADSATARNARVHSWIEHQYDFVLAEHRLPSVDRPDSPLLPRPSTDRAISPCPSYDALFFPTKSDVDDFEEQERIRTLRFIVQEMAHWKSHAHPSPRLSPDKPLPAPPPSPASSMTSSRAMRSRSSSTRISRLPSFTSTLSSDQSSPKELPPPPPLPVSVVVHAEFQHDLVLSRDCPLIDGYLHKRNDSYSLLHEQDAQMLCTLPDDLDSSLLPSPTFSTFSGAHSRDTSFTTATSPVSAVFCPSQCSPQDIALPLSPVDEAHRIISPEVSTQSLRAPKLERSQSRWSLATTASMAPSNSDAKSNVLLNMRLSPKDKSLKTPSKKRTRFISLISRLSPARVDPTLSTSTQATDDFDCDSLEDSDGDDKDKPKPRKSLSKKSSLASLRASFSVSRASFSSQRPSVSSPTDIVPPLPTSPTSPTISSRLAEVVPTQLPKASKIPSRANIVTAPLPPIPQSASSLTSLHSVSCISISEGSESPASRSTPANISRVSLLPPPSKRTSLASAAGIEPVALPTGQPVTRSKSIFRLPPRPKSIKVPPPGTKMSAQSKLPHPTALPSPPTVRSRIPQSPAKFNPPTKLATVIATQTRSPPLVSVPTAPSKLPTPPSRMQPKVVRPMIEKLPVENLAPSSRLPTAAKSVRVSTVKGFWKRQQSR